MVATQAKSSGECKVVDTEGAGVKQEVNSEAEKESLGRESGVRTMRRREGPT